MKNEFYAKSIESSNVELSIHRESFETTFNSFKTHKIEYGDTLYITTTVLARYQLAFKATYIARETITKKSFWHNDEGNDYKERVYFKDIEIIKELPYGIRESGRGGSRSFAKI